MSDNTNRVPPLESSLDSQLTENDENRPHVDMKNTHTMDARESSNNPQISSESQSNERTPKNIDWQKLAHKLREHNRKLLKRVFTLEQEAAEAQNRCQEQNDQFLQNNLLVEQQAERLNNHQEEVAHLLQELETSQQKLQEQQDLAKNLSQQLEISQQETAKIERECAKLQDANNEKDYQILAANKQIQELHTRLDRQQQNIMKYRAAVEKYVSTGDFSQPTVASSSLPRFNNSEPIKSWSETNSQLKKTPVSPALVEVAEHSEVSPAVAKKEATSKSNSNWPAPEIARVNKENQPKSIAAVQLPRFPRKSSS